MQLKINRLNLFIGLAAFLLVVNLLVIFDLNLFYIRAVLGFIFIIGVPGLLIMLSLKIREVGFWEYLVYTVGLSISFIMFAGLAVNWILPWLNITDRPLDTLPIVICFDIFLLALGLVAYKRNKGLKYETKFPKLGLLNNIFFIVPMLFPVMAILGAFILNNGGPNYITMVMLGGIAVYVFCIVLFRDKLNENIYPWAILCISLALFFSFSMRSWYVNGGDVNKEYGVFNLTVASRYWSLDKLESTYEAMLSVSILPAIIYFITNINMHFVIKIFYPIIFIFVPLIIYLTSKKYFDIVLCFLASFFFLSQQVMFNWTDLPIRQELAFIFFSLMLLLLSSKKVKINLKSALLMIFGFTMIVSHYSTTYIAITIFLVSYLLFLVYQLLENKKIKKVEIKSKREFILNLTKIFILIIFGFLWYNQITSTGTGLIDFTHNSVSNLGDLFNEEFQAEGKTPLDRFNIFSPPPNKTQELTNYVAYWTKRYTVNQTTDNYNSDTQITNLNSLPSKINYTVTAQIYLFFEILKRLMYIFIGIGFIFILFSKRKKLNENINYLIFLVSFFSIFCILIFLPFISIKYSLLRVYQQFLLFLSPLSVIGILLFIKISKIKKDQLIFTVSVFIILFLFTSGFITQIIGGSYAAMRLSNNNSIEYDLYFTHRTELFSSNWLFTHYKAKVYSDVYTSTKLSLSDNRNSIHKITTHILPILIEKESYVYLGYSNIAKQTVFNSYGNTYLFYKLPVKFLKNTKNKIYDNGGSEIFR